MTYDFWFQFSILSNAAGNLKSQLTGQGYILIYTNKKKTNIYNLHTQQNRRKHVKEYNLNKPIVYEDYNIARFNSKESLLCIIQK